MAGERGVVNLAFLLSKENLHKTPGAIEYQPTSWAPALPTLCANFFQGRTPFFFCPLPNRPLGDGLVQ